MTESVQNLDTTTSVSNGIAGFSLQVLPRICRDFSFRLDMFVAFSFRQSKGLSQITTELCFGDKNEDLEHRNGQEVEF
jgi:hypothetical protein